MIKLLVFDKDGVILDLAQTWLPVVRAVADYTISRIPPAAADQITAGELLASIGVDERTGQIDPAGVFAKDSFFAIQSIWQALLPAEMFDLAADATYQAEVDELVLKLVHGRSIPKGDIKTPLGTLHAAGFHLALLTNDSERSAQQNLDDMGVGQFFAPVVGADSGHGTKPTPEGLLFCCAEHGVAPTEAIMIGDTSADYGAAIAAGVADFICIADDLDLLPNPAIKPESVIAELTALPDLLLRRGDTLLGPGSS